VLEATRNILLKKSWKLEYELAMMSDRSGIGGTKSVDEPRAEEIREGPVFLHYTAKERQKIPQRVETVEKDLEAAIKSCDADETLRLCHERLWLNKRLADIRD
jgi:hypothetical protein